MDFLLLLPTPLMSWALRHSKRNKAKKIFWQFETKRTTYFDQNILLKQNNTTHFCWRKTKQIKKKLLAKRNTNFVKMKQNEQNVFGKLFVVFTAVVNCWFFGEIQITSQRLYFFQCFSSRSNKVGVKGSLAKGFCREAFCLTFCDEVFRHEAFPFILLIELWEKGGWEQMGFGIWK